MKKIILVSLLLLSAAPSVPALAQPAMTAESETLIPLTGKPTVAKGMTPDTVLFMLGVPGAKLAPNVWVYWDFKVANVPSGEKYDTMIVVFTTDRVSDIKLCQSQPVRAFIARQQLTPAKTTIAAK